MVLRRSWDTAATSAAIRGSALGAAVSARTAIAAAAHNIRMKSVFMALSANASIRNGVREESRSTTCRAGDGLARPGDHRHGAAGVRKDLRGAGRILHPAPDHY